MELFEQIRREYAFTEGSSIRGLASQFGVHRRAVRQAIASAVPPDRLQPERARPRLAPVIPFIDQILESDRTAPRKQRHTAHRIFVRLQAEYAWCSVAESTVRQYVRERKAQMGMLARETFVAQVYSPGQEAQIDWYEAWVDMGGERIKAQVFAMRAMGSGGAFHRAYRRATQQAFLEAHEHGFEYFGGVFRTLRYDNLTSAVTKVLRGHKREETTRFIAFRSHWQFDAQFCNVVSPEEKGGVEGEAGYFRRNHFVPVPSVTSFEDLNSKLLEGCRLDEQRLIGDRRQTVGSGMVSERAFLLPLAAEGFDIAVVRTADVDNKGCVKTGGNSYSAPLHAGTHASIRILPGSVAIWHSGRQVAIHPRCYGRGEQILELTHYLDVLHRKPGALAGSRSLAQWREQGRWPLCFDTLWDGLKTRHGDMAGTRQMVEVLQLSSAHTQAGVVAAVTKALALGTGDVAAITYLLNETMSSKTTVSSRSEAPIAPLPLSMLTDLSLSRFERALPDVTTYDQLLRPRSEYAATSRMMEASH